MGCGQSSGEAQVKFSRRRLTVGSVDCEAEPGSHGDKGEDDPGTMASLNEKSIIEMVGKDQGRKMSIGSSTDYGKTSFSNKSTSEGGDRLDPTEWGIGYTCRKGLKPESPNQDSWFILKMESHSIYAVFDGHGSKGHDVSNFVKDNLPKLILRDQRFKTAKQGEMLQDVFKKTQSLVATADRMKKLSAQMSGTTATVCIHDHKNQQITVGHVADSSCVFGRGEGAQLTRDHKPNLTDERARIEKAGGRVVFDGYANHRVYAKHARYPGLNMSRCLGDLLGHNECGISCEPEVTERRLAPGDRVLLLCSDGVWEFIGAKEAVSIVMEYPFEKAMTSAESLAKESWDRWIREEGGAIVDDITVVLVRLDGVQDGHAANKLER